MTWTGLDHPDALHDVPWYLQVLLWPVFLFMRAYYWAFGCRPDDGRHS